MSIVPVRRKYCEDDPFFVAGDLSRQAKYLVLCEDEVQSACMPNIHCNQPGCGVICNSMKQVKVNADFLVIDIV